MARTDPRPNYGVGRRVRADGYIDVWDPGHPLARRDGYLMEHRQMAWAAGLLTDPALQVHHVNEQRDDNRLENFEIKSGSVHALEHAEERGWVRNQYGTWLVKPGHQRVNAPRPVRDCVHCQEQIPLTLRRQAIYCSSRCRMAAYRRRHRT